jgi:hypothetical protein
MASTREQVREALEQMSDDEAPELLALIRTIEHRRNNARVFDKLRGDPTFRVPAPDAPPFRHFEPIKASGKPASEMLVEDRR